jgi:GntR family L-lactate dehydrogenase operon transcriptional regulator
VRGFFITDDEQGPDLMHNRRQRIEFAVLDVLAKTPRWTGASSLRQHLRVSGIEVGEATVGRVLSDLDMLGCTRKAGKLGRTVTKKGLAHLEALRLELERETSGRKITSFFSSFKDPEALIEVLEARRAVERETARLAAAKATPAQIVAMREAIAAHHRAVSEGSIDTQHDFSLHQTIAVASGNGLLISLLEMIRKDREVSAVVRKAREREHVQCAREHDAILAAIERRDPVAAERAMETHLDGLIETVRSYALRAPAERNEGRRPVLARRVAVS